MEELLDLSAKGLLQSGLLPQAENEEDQRKIYSFLDRITDEQAAQLLALDGFAEEYQIPVWEADLGGPAKDANREHDTPPDRFIQGTTAPRDITDDLYILIHSAKSFFDIPVQIDTFGQLSQTNKKYWEELKKIFPAIPSVGGKRPDMISLAVDILNKNYIWSQATEGNLTNPVRDKHKNPKETSTRCIIDFKALEGMKLSKKLDHKDEAIYTAAANLWYAGNEYFSLSMLHQIYHESRPGGKDLDEIDARLFKMGMTRLELNNREESEVTNYPHFKYEGLLLPMERVSCYINGKLTEQAIHLFREPPMFTYARERGAIVNVDQKFLAPPINRNERTDHLNTYLLRIIKTAQRDKGITNRITFETIFDELDLEKGSIQSRFKGYVKRLFDFYKEGGLITGYDMDKRGITFLWDEKKLAGICKKTSGKV